MTQGVRMLDNIDISINELIKVGVYEHVNQGQVCLIVYANYGYFSRLTIIVSYYCSLSILSLS